MRQHHTDSLRIALSYAKEDTAKVRLLLKIGYDLFDSSDDEMIKYVSS